MKNLKSDVKSSKKEMLELGEKILAMNIENRKDYIKKYEDLVSEIKLNETIKETDALVCPKCGSKLVLRTARKGANSGNQFYGCSAFPKCRFIKNVE